MSSFAHPASNAVRNALRHETAHLRKELAQSNARVQDAKTSKPANLRPKQGEAMTRAWQSSAEEIVIDPVAEQKVSRNPDYKVMRATLRQFEQRRASMAPAKERAFHGALRALLADIVKETRTDLQADKIRAAAQWHAKYHPEKRRETAADSASGGTGTTTPRVDIHDKAAFLGIFSAGPSAQLTATFAPPKVTPRNHGTGKKATLLSDPSSVNMCPVPMRPTPALSAARRRPKPAEGPMELDEDRSKFYPPESDGHVHDERRAATLHRLADRWVPDDLRLAERGTGAAAFEDARTRWKRTGALQENFQRDVDNAMARYALHRSRVEEEISRRLETRRFLPPPGQAPIAEPHPYVPGAVTQLSPYTRMGEVDDLSTRFHDFVREVKAGAHVKAVSDAASATVKLTNMGWNVSEEAVSRVLVPPADRTMFDIMHKLPAPGASLGISLPAVPNEKKKKGKKKGRRRKK